MIILIDVARILYQDPCEDATIDLVSYLFSWVSKDLWLKNVSWDMSGYVILFKNSKIRFLGEVTPNFAIESKKESSWFDVKKHLSLCLA